MPTSPLDGLLVIDMSRALAGPWAAMTLGDLGAEVIKIEDPRGGDVTRGYPPFWNGESAYYMSANRNKRSVTINLESAAGRAVIRELVAKADVLIESFRTGAMETWGLGAEELLALNPRLIYCAVSAVGRDGPDKDRAGVDLLMQAYAGLMSITGEPGRAPVRTGTSVVDLTTGANAVQSILAALYVRERSGQGQRVDVSLLGSVVSWLSYHAVGYFATGVVPQAMGSAHPSVAPYGTYPTREGFIVIAVALDSSWKRFCLAVGRPDLIDHPDLARNADRIRNRNMMDDLIAEILVAKTAAEWTGIMDAHGVPASPINSIDTVVGLPQTLQQELIVSIPHPQIPDLRTQGIALKLSETPASIRRHPPLLGEHTEEVLAELGRTSTEIATLRTEGVIA
ncbi:MAG TPA: CoA transferase [Thermomicrobiales bacterium]|nr:CoA transferase [Thermomicrobiales bacterium]